MEKVKNIVFAGLSQGWSYNNIISQIMFAMATKEESEPLGLWSDMDDLPYLKNQAEKAYKKYREEYYKVH